MVVKNRAYLVDKKIGVTDRKITEQFDLLKTKLENLSDVLEVGPFYPHELGTYPIRFEMLEDDFLKFRKMAEEYHIARNGELGAFDETSLFSFLYEEQPSISENPNCFSYGTAKLCVPLPKGYNICTIEHAMDMDPVGPLRYVYYIKFHSIYLAFFNNAVDNFIKYVKDVKNYNSSN